MRTLTSIRPAAAILAIMAMSGGPAHAAPGASASATASVLLDSGTAAFYSLILPGSGQIWAGEWLRGGFLMGISSTFLGLGVAGYILKNNSYMQTAGAGLMVMSLVAPVDAYFLVSDRNREKLDVALSIKGKAIPQ